MKKVLDHDFLNRIFLSLTKKWLRYFGLAFLLVIVLLIPKAVTTPYFIHILILFGMYLLLSLSYDLTVGQVGALSLAHPAFFGIGAYAGAILAVNTKAPIWLAFLAGILMGVILSIAIGIPSFNLGGHSFAIGTLGFALIVELIARNWIDVTRGPMGIPGIPKPVIRIPGLFTWHITSLVDFYYFMVILVILGVLFYWLISTSRIGRAFRAVREDEVLAAASGLHPRAYKMLAFITGAGIAAALGVFYAYWFSLVSPELLNIYQTTILLIIVFLAGRGSLRGIILTALLVTAIPEFLRIAPELRLVLYGIILLLAVIYFPDGIEGLLQKVAPKR